jgi:hypothetical protein
MASRDIAEDVSFLLYLVPLVAGIVYGAYEWAILPHSYDMPGLAYLIVSKSPYLFLISVIAVGVALLFEVRGTPVLERSRIIQSNSTRMQILAISVLVLSYLAAVSVAGYSFGNGAAVFIAGRYPLIFAFGLIIWSFFLNPRQLIGNARMSSFVELVGLLLVGSSPVIVYGGSKLHLGIGLSAVCAIIVGIIGLYLFFNNSKLFSAKQPVKVPQQTPQAPKTTTQATTNN